MLLVYSALPDPWIQPIIWCLLIIPNPEGDALLEVPVQDEYGWGPANQEFEPDTRVLVPGAELHLVWVFE